jgi:hypothetical protein
MQDGKQRKITKHDTRIYERTERKINNISFFLPTERNDDNIHLLPLDNYCDSENSSNESEDDSIEVVSNIDEEENQIVDLTKDLAFTSSSDDELEASGSDNHCPTLDAININRSQRDIVVNHHPTHGVVNNNRSSFDGVVTAVILFRDIEHSGTSSNNSGIAGTDSVSM